MTTEALPSAARPEAVTREFYPTAGRRFGGAGKDPRSPAPAVPEAVCGAEAKQKADQVVTGTPLNLALKQAGSPAERR